MFNDGGLPYFAREKAVDLGMWRICSGGSLCLSVQSDLERRKVVLGGTDKEELNRKNWVHCLFIMGLGYLGKSDWQKQKSVWRRPQP